MLEAFITLENLFVELGTTRVLLLFVLMLHLCREEGFLLLVEKEGLKGLLSSAPIQLGRGEVLFVNKQLVFFSTSNYTSCKEKGKLLVE